MSKDTVVELHQWHTADELADLEDVSTRTIYRKLERGEVEKKQTSEGTRYRVSSTDMADSHDTDTDSVCVSNQEDKTTDSGVSSVSQLTAVVSDMTERIGELERQVGRLKAENEQLRRQLDNQKTSTSSGDEGPSYAQALAEMMAGERTIEEVRAIKKNG